MGIAAAGVSAGCEPRELAAGSDGITTRSRKWSVWTEGGWLAVCDSVLSGVGGRCSCVTGWNGYVGLLAGWKEVDMKVYFY